jgi:hypothetical protein
MHLKLFTTLYFIVTLFMLLKSGPLPLPPYFNHLYSSKRLQLDYLPTKDIMTIPTHSLRSSLSYPCPTLYWSQILNFFIPTSSITYPRHFLTLGKQLLKFALNTTLNFEMMGNFSYLGLYRTEQIARMPLISLPKLWNLFFPDLSESPNKSIFSRAVSLYFIHRPIVSIIISNNSWSVPFLSFLPFFCLFVLVYSCFLLSLLLTFTTLSSFSSFFFFFLPLSLSLFYFIPCPMPDHPLNKLNQTSLSVLVLLPFLLLFLLPRNPGMSAYHASPLKTAYTLGPAAYVCQYIPFNYSKEAGHGLNERRVAVNSYS